MASRFEDWLSYTVWPLYIKYPSLSISEENLPFCRAPCKFFTWC